MSNSWIKPIQTLLDLAAQPFRLTAPLHKLFHEPHTFQAVANGERDKKIAGGLNRQRASILLLRPEGLRNVATH